MNITMLLKNGRRIKGQLVNYEYSNGEYLLMIGVKGNVLPAIYYVAKEKVKGVYLNA
jgi:hypothetical protein